MNSVAIKTVSTSEVSEAEDVVVPFSERDFFRDGTLETQKDSNGYALDEHIEIPGATESRWQSVHEDGGMYRAINVQEPAVENLLEDIPGVVVATTENSVTVRFRNHLEIDYPRLLLAKGSQVTYGQEVKYQILRRIDGYRYQQIVVSDTPVSNPQFERISGIISGISSKRSEND